MIKGSGDTNGQNSADSTFKNIDWMKKSSERSPTWIPDVEPNKPFVVNKSVPTTDPSGYIVTKSPDG